MNSFNVYGQTETKVGGNTPVWLGTVKPIPVGATFYGYSYTFFRAGCPVKYNPSTQAIEIIFNESDLSELGEANAYLYNDIRSEAQGQWEGTGAIVMHHPEGLLIERVLPEITEEQIATLQKNIPGVLLVRESNQSAE